MATITKSHAFGDRDITLETGRMAKLADGAVAVTYGETQVLATCVSSNPREGIDFFPLTIDVEERMYAAGKIPGSFFRREGRPSETAILTCRLIDRPLRPTFKDGFRDEVQVVITVLGVDGENPYDIPAMNAASVATCLAGLPFDGPVASVRMGLIDGQWVINPTFQQVEEATFDVVVAGRKNDAGEIDVLMIEGEAPDNTWDLLAGGARRADRGDRRRGARGREARDRRADRLPAGVRRRGRGHRAGVDPASALRRRRLRDRLVVRGRPSRRGDRARQGRARGEARRAEGGGEGARRRAARRRRASDRLGEFGAAWKQVQKKVMRARVIKEGIRLDGRTPTEIRPLSAEVGVLKRAHGSALFSRGDTQVLNITTLGMLRMTQMIDTLDLEDTKRYMHHYNFPPFSTGETGRVGSPRRREIGHGALAERALIPVVPHEDEFPYALRLVSDVLSSNGSTSMASVCGSTLSLMDAGVPIKAPVAGIAMGMIADDGAFVTLTDILGAEDALGDMDFKVAGTREFVTAIQLDMKVTGLPGSVLADALKQAREARFQILDVMEAAIPAPREEVNAKAPRIISIQIPVDKIGEVIGPKGKRINEIIALTGADIDIQDDGTVLIGSTLGAEGADEAAHMIDEIANPRPVLVGEQYEGTVVKTTTFGAFVNLVPGRDGLVHISKLGKGKRLSSVEEAVKEGDTLTVLVEDIDTQGKISLKPVGEEWAIPEGQADESGSDAAAVATAAAAGSRRPWRSRPRPWRRPG